MAPADTYAGTGTDDLSGRLLAGRYRLNRIIASGGMATVWEASDQLLGRRVAVKVLHPHLARDDSFVRRFRAEAVAAARLSHPSIVSVYDTVSDDEIDAIVMELVTGTTLRADLDEFGPLKLHAAVAVGTQVAEALTAAHAAGLVHRDVKPANILLSADGRVLVADFGIAKAAQGSDMTEVGSMIGTAKYLAPEQVEGGPIDGRADLYALGVVLYEALTGRPPFVAETDAGTAFARLHRDPTPPTTIRPDVPPALEAVVLRAMARRPEDRFTDGAAMRNALVATQRNPTGPGRSTWENPLSPPAAVPPSPVTPPQSATPPPPSPPLTTQSATQVGHQAPDGHLAPVDRSARQPHPTPPRPSRRRAPWIVLVLIVVGVLVGLLAALGLFSVASSSTGSELAIARVGSFDPEGDRTEKDDLLPNLVDSDDRSTWRTETYRAQGFPSGGGDKAGVGFYVVLDGARTIEEMTLRTPAGGWAAEIFVADVEGGGKVPTDLTGWGRSVAVVDDAPTGAVKVPMSSAKGSAVLVWFTRATQFEDLHAVQISDVTVRGR